MKTFDTVILIVLAATFLAIGAVAGALTMKSIVVIEARLAGCEVVGP